MNLLPLEKSWVQKKRSDCIHSIHVCSHIFSGTFSKFFGCIPCVVTFAVWKSAVALASRSQDIKRTSGLKGPKVDGSVWTAGNPWKIPLVLPMVDGWSCVKNGLVKSSEKMKQRRVLVKKMLWTLFERFLQKQKPWKGGLGCWVVHQFGNDEDN